MSSFCKFEEEGQTFLLTEERDFIAFKSPTQSSAVFGSTEIRDRILKVWIRSFGLTSGSTVLYTASSPHSVHPLPCMLLLWLVITQYLFCFCNSCLLEKIILWKLYSTSAIGYFFKHRPQQMVLVDCCYHFAPQCPREIKAACSQIWFPFWQLCLCNKQCL